MTVKGEGEGEGVLVRLHHGQLVDVDKGAVAVALHEAADAFRLGAPYVT